MPSIKQKGTPQWMTSFTYLLILLLSFFILMLSASEIDAQKYKKIIIAFEQIFGVSINIDHQNSLHASSVLQKYSTANTSIAVKTIVDNAPYTFPDLAHSQSSTNVTNNVGLSISQDLIAEIKSGMLDVQSNPDSVTIRLNEQYSFESGSANIKNDLYPALNKISSIISKTPGKITVAGFTDDVPMQNTTFHDNWELSALRAYIVLSILVANEANDPARFTLIANGSNKPLYPNNSINNRSKNRRVEITLIQEEVKIDTAKKISVIDK